jgi:hypothetical protein
LTGEAVQTFGAFLDLVPRAVIGGRDEEVGEGDAESGEFMSRAFLPPLWWVRRVVKTWPLSVRVEAGTPWVSQAARKVSRVMGTVTRWLASAER